MSVQHPSREVRYAPWVRIAGLFIAVEFLVYESVPAYWVLERMLHLDDDQWIDRDHSVASTVWMGIVGWPFAATLALPVAAVYGWSGGLRPWPGRAGVVTAVGAWALTLVPSLLAFASSLLPWTLHPLLRPVLWPLGMLVVVAGWFPGLVAVRIAARYFDTEPQERGRSPPWWIWLVPGVLCCLSVVFLRAVFSW